MADEAFAENPWSAEHFNLTRQGDYIKKYGLEVAKTKAKQAGAKLGQFAVVPTAKANFTVIVQRRNLGGNGSGVATGTDNALVAGLTTKV
jgi:hypothetical protein